MNKIIQKLDLIQNVQTYSTVNNTSKSKLSHWKIDLGLTSTASTVASVVGIAGILGAGAGFALGTAISFKVGLMVGGALITAIAVGILFVCKKSSKDTNKPTNLPLPWNIKPNVMQQIQQTAPRLYLFLTDPNFKWNPKIDYDLRVEDVFGVLWIAPNRDSAFLQSFRTKFQNDLPLLNQVSDQSRFTLQGQTRLANNNIAQMFHLGQTSPKANEMLRDALCYCLSKL